MASSNNSAPQIIAQADELYFAREDIANVWTSVALLRSNRNEVDGYELAWRLSRALFFLGQEGTDTARTLHAQGVAAGKQAVRARPERVEGHFWLGVNLALLARDQPRIKAVATALRAKRSLQRALTIDSAYHAAGPLRVLARLQQGLPRLLGGGSARAQYNYEKAIGLAPSNTVTRLYFAELLLERGEIDRARAQLEVVHKATFDPDWAFEIKRDQRIANELLARL